MEKTIIVSNNPRVWNKYPGCIRISGDYKDVLIAARDYIHLGNSLLCHPLAGSIKPNETPYKSLALREGQGKLDFKSLLLIESAIETFNKFPLVDRMWSDQILKDFQVIDEDLLNSAFVSLAPKFTIKV